MNTEQRIIELAKTKDKSAMEALFRANFKQLYVFVRCKVATNEIAEDICSESFTKAFENLKRFKGKSSFKSWLFTIAKNQVIDWYKVKGKTEPITFEVAAKDIVDPAKQSHEKKVLKIFDKLKNRYREVLEYRFLLNLSINETAEIMGVKPNNIKILQHRALKKAEEIGKNL